VKKLSTSVEKSWKWDFKYLHADFGIQPRTRNSNDVAELGPLCKNKGISSHAGAISVISSWDLSLIKKIRFAFRN
jgi:hypothetical protein